MKGRHLSSLTGRVIAMVEAAKLDLEVKRQILARNGQQRQETANRMQILAVPGRAFYLRGNPGYKKRKTRSFGALKLVGFDE